MTADEPAATMRQRVHLITLGTDDLVRARSFYTALGWKPAAESPPGLVAFNLFGAVLGLYPRESQIRDIGRDLPAGSGSVVLSCNTRSLEEVAQVIDAARAAGAEILKEPHEVFWGGHVGYFTDPDGHIWEVAWNPFSPLGDQDDFSWSAG